jgi:hypothetical protein
MWANRDAGIPDAPGDSFPRGTVSHKVPAREEPDSARWLLAALVLAAPVWIALIWVIVRVLARI